MFQFQGVALHTEDLPAIVSRALSGRPPTAAPRYVGQPVDWLVALLDATRSLPWGRHVRRHLREALDRAADGEFAVLAEVMFRRDDLDGPELQKALARGTARIGVREATLFSLASLRAISRGLVAWGPLWRREALLPAYDGALTPAALRFDLQWSQPRLLTLLPQAPIRARWVLDLAVLGQDRQTAAQIAAAVLIASAEASPPLAWTIRSWAEDVRASLPSRVTTTRDITPSSRVAHAAPPIQSLGRRTALQASTMLWWDDHGRLYALPQTYISAEEGQVVRRGGEVRTIGTLDARALRLTPGAKARVLRQSLQAAWSITRQIAQVLAPNEATSAVPATHLPESLEAWVDLSGLEQLTSDELAARLHGAVSRWVSDAGLEGRFDALWRTVVPPPPERPGAR